MKRLLLKHSIPLLVTISLNACAHQPLPPECERSPRGACCYLRNTEVESALGLDTGPKIEQFSGSTSTCRFEPRENNAKLRVLLTWYSTKPEQYPDAGAPLAKTQVPGLPAEAYWVPSAYPGSRGQLIVRKQHQFFSLEAEAVTGHPAWMMEREIARWVLRRLEYLPKE